jgi:hypothetical protein
MNDEWRSVVVSAVGGMMNDEWRSVVVSAVGGRSVKVVSEAVVGVVSP